MDGAVPRHSCRWSDRLDDLQPTHLVTLLLFLGSLVTSLHSKQAIMTDEMDIGDSDAPPAGASRLIQSESLQKEVEQPHFPQVTVQQAGGSEYRRVRCPPHRYTPLREHWEQILTPLVEYLKLQVRVDGSNIIMFVGSRGRRNPLWTRVSCCSWTQTLREASCLWECMVRLVVAV